MLTKTKLMTNANEETQDVNEEIYETDTDTEETGETTEESETEQTAEETVTLAKDEYEKLKRGLARKARIESKEKGDSQESESGFDQDLISRTYLAAQAQITDPDVQDEALRLANKFGMKIDQAMKDADISMRLKNLQKQKQTQAAIAGNGGVNVGKPRSVEQYTAEYKKTGKLPDDPRLVSKILDELTKK